MSEVQVRQARLGDGPGCARIWLDAARYYADLDPETFQVPAELGLADWFEAIHAETSPDALRLVATIGHDLAGLVSATLQPTSPDAHRSMMRARLRPLVYVGALAVAERNRRAGVGSALMAAVERWGRERGAALISLDTNLRSPLSVSFYERIGYARHAVIFQKSLG
jgi:GNAT superfamily N-acetyltransferase